jgi:hypothetical protein
MAERTTTAEDIAKARTDVQIVMAQVSNLRLRVQRGQLIERDQLERAASGFFHRIRDRTLDAPARQSAVIAAEFDLDSARLHVALDGVLRRLLHEAADSPPSQ